MREPTVRQRNSKSCDFCAQKKQKCKVTEEGQACAACKDLGQLCTFDRGIKKRGMKMGFVQKLKKEVFHLQTLVEQKSFHEAMAVQPESHSTRPFSEARASNASGDSYPTSVDYNNSLFYRDRSFDYSGRKQSYYSSSGGASSKQGSSGGASSKQSYYSSSNGASTSTNSLSVSTESIFSSISSQKNQAETSTIDMLHDLSLDPLTMAFGAIEHDSHSQNQDLDGSVETRLETVKAKKKAVKLSSTIKHSGFISSEFSQRNSFVEEKSFDSYEKLENWSVLTFYLLTVQISKTKKPFLDIYFETVWAKIPLFHKSWLSDNMADFPLWLLHIMYACCLDNQVDSKNKKLSLYHYEYCVKYLMNNLDNANPFHIVASLHCMVYIIQNDPSNIAYISHLGTCVQIAQVLGLHRDEELFWTSPIGTALGTDKTPFNQNFLRTLWYLLYRYDWSIYIIHNHDFFIGTELSLTSLRKWNIPITESGNSNEGHYLFHFHLLGPILESVKKVLYHQNEQNTEILNYRLEALVDIDATLSKQQYSLINVKDYLKDHNCDPSIRHFHEIYHFSRLCLLKSQLIHYVQDRSITKPSILVLFACKYSAKSIVELANLYDPKVKRPEYFMDQVHTYFQAGLFLILVGFLGGLAELETMRDYIENLICTLEMMLPEDSKELAILKEFDPELAFNELSNQ